MVSHREACRKPDRPEEAYNLRPAAKWNNQICECVFGQKIAHRGSVERIAYCMYMSGGSSQRRLG